MSFAPFDQLAARLIQDSLCILTLYQNLIWPRLRNLEITNLADVLCDPDCLHFCVDIRDDIGG